MTEDLLLGELRADLRHGLKDSFSRDEMAHVIEYVDRLTIERNNLKAVQDRKFEYAVCELLNALETEGRGEALVRLLGGKVSTTYVTGPSPTYVVPHAGKKLLLLKGPGEARYRWAYGPPKRSPRRGSE
jgi:hypothetical protein